MEDKVKQNLLNIQSEPSTGMKYNSQTLYSQVENIFAIDRLTEELKKLTNKIDKYNKSASKASKLMSRLTVIMVIVVVLQFGIGILQLIITLS